MIQRASDRYRQRFSSDEGVTLPEMLMAIVIGGIIIAAVAMALVVAMGPDKAASARMAESHDAQLLSIYLPADLLSVSPTGLDTSGAAFACTGGVPADTTNVLTLNWAQAAPSAQTWTVAYRQSTSGTQTRLIRYSCQDGGTVTQIVVARNLKSSGGAVVSLSGTRVTLTLTEASGFSYKIVGSRRTPDSSTGACRATSIATSPNPVSLDSSNVHLVSNVVVTVSTSGSCATPLQLTFTPSTSSVTQAFSGTGTYTTTINASAATWTSGTKTLTVTQSDSGAVVDGTANLSVSAYVPPCTSTSVVASPNPVAGNAAGNLASDVTVSVTVTGGCSVPLNLSFSPSATPQTVELSGTGPYTTTIGASAYTWTGGEKTLTVTQSGGGAVVDGTTTLTVTAYVAPCSVTSVTPSPAGVGRNGSGKLSANVTVTVVTSGSCSGLKLRFMPQATNVDVSLSQSGANWTYMIGKNDYTWNSGPHALTVLNASDVAFPTTGSLQVDP